MFPDINEVGQAILPLFARVETSTAITERHIDGSFVFSIADSIHPDTEKHKTDKILRKTEITDAAAIVRGVLKLEKIISDCTGSPANGRSYCMRMKHTRTVSENTPSSRPSKTDTFSFL